MKPLILKNNIQKYAWGSRVAIQKLLEVPSSGEPWAELWMGAHPKSPSKVNMDGQWVSLPDYIRRFPEEILGHNTAKRFNNALPYLFKVLAAEQPLSIQAHPNAMQAKIGFERESAAGVDITAPDRNYKDSHHKPECICALTPFTGLKGFRRISSTIELFERFCPQGLADGINALKQQDLKIFFKFLMELPVHRKEAIILETVENAEKQIMSDQTSEWILKLYRRYPSDIGIISPLFLNLFCLEPGQALFLPAGELHAYLDGLGIELMANSDNVLRGGLTPKHVDVPELLNVLNFTESDIEILLPQEISECEGQFPVFAEEFILSTIRVSKSKTYISNDKHSVEILLCIQGMACLTSGPDKEDVLDLKKGDSVFIPAAADPYQIAGNALFYKAAVPL